MKSYRFIAIFCLLGFAFQWAFAQQPAPREDDQFWARRLVVRVDLNEKLNKPYISKPNDLYSDKKGTGRHPYKEGLVRSLLNAYVEGKITGYDPRQLNEPIAPEEFIQKLAYLNLGQKSPDVLANKEPQNSEDKVQDTQNEAYDENAKLAEEASAKPEEGETTPPASESGEGELTDGTENDPNIAEGNEPKDEEDKPVDISSEEMDDDDPDVEKAHNADIELNVDPANQVTLSDKINTSKDDLFLGTEEVIEFIEDRGFDRNKSSEYSDIKYIRIVWVDVQGVIPFRNVVAFKFEDVASMLDSVQFTNPMNDAAHHSVLDMLVNHNYTGMIVNVAGKDVKTKAEAETRRVQLIEFEHEVWSY